MTIIITPIVRCVIVYKANFPVHYFIYPLLTPLKKAILYCYPHLIGSAGPREVKDLAQGFTAAPGPQLKFSQLPGLAQEILFLSCMFISIPGKKP